MSSLGDINPSKNNEKKGIIMLLVSQSFNVKRIASNFFEVFFTLEKSYGFSDCICLVHLWSHNKIRRNF
jgi:hypothetical protein